MPRYRVPFSGSDALHLMSVGCTTNTYDLGAHSSLQFTLLFPANLIFLPVK